MAKDRQKWRTFVVALHASCIPGKMMNGFVLFFSVENLKNTNICVRACVRACVQENLTHTG